jgi:hypothetical protein
MTVRRIATALALLALTAACGSDEPPPVAVETEPSTAEVAEPAGEVDPPLLVDAGGLRLLDRSGGGARRFAFGSGWQGVRDALAFRGEAETGTNRECRAGPLEFARWPDGLTLYAQAGKFAGWALDGRSAGTGAAGGISTAAGIGPGRTRADLDKAYSPAISQTDLGTEFSTGGLSGVLDGPDQTAQIIALWAGTSCNFG